MRLEQESYIDLYYGDESGFSLTPYGWQEVGKTDSIPSQRGGQINIFGIMSRNNDCESYCTEGRINSETVIAFIDDFVLKICKKTVLVLDNAPIHKSHLFKSRIEDWKDKGLRIFFLPRYSPHLNIIETLWRKMKYEWLKPKDYESKKNLVSATENILANIGQKYSIKFNCSKVSNILW